VHGSVAVQAIDGLLSLPKVRPAPVVRRSQARHGDDIEHPHARALEEVLGEAIVALVLRPVPCVVGTNERTMVVALSAEERGEGIDRLIDL
jgi:hypothetical protein